MEWTLLFIAILFEVCGTLCAKLSSGFSRIIPSVLMVIFYVSSVIYLTVALKKIDVGVAYAIWSGFGTAVIATIGIVFFHEPAGIVKLASIAMIILGVIGLNLYGSI